MSEEQTPQEKPLTIDDIHRIIIGEDKYKVINVVNGLNKRKLHLYVKQVEALTAKPSGEDQK